MLDFFALKSLFSDFVNRLFGRKDGEPAAVACASTGPADGDSDAANASDGAVVADEAEAVRESKPEDLHEQVKTYLFAKYNFRFNVLTEQTEYRLREGNGTFAVVDRRVLNTLVIEVREQGMNCWDKDVARLLRSYYVGNFHPFYDYMSHLPEWDGVDRVGPLALRVDDSPVWTEGFHRWMLALTAQWMGVEMRCANTLTPLLLSTRQGLAKSTFCRLLMPPELRAYYLDKFDLNSRSNVELKLGQFGLINLDEFDRYSAAAVASLKNLVQLKNLTVRKAYAGYFSQLGRIASFIGTSNVLELLNDPSGSRRFLCVEVKHPIDCSPLDYAQLFAQLKAEVVSGERLWMDEAEERKLQEHNRFFKRLHPEQEVFFRLFGLPEREGDGRLLSVAEIFRRLCDFNGKAMRGISVVQLGRSLTELGLKRVHTRWGNRYWVKEVAMA